MENKRINKNKSIKQKKQALVLRKWILDNGCANFDLKHENIILYDGGLFSIEKVIEMHPKVLKTSHCGEVIFTKKKFPTEILRANMWIKELDETIAYFQRMKKMLNSMGFKTKNEKIKK